MAATGWMPACTTRPIAVVKRETKPIAGWNGRRRNARTVWPVFIFLASRGRPSAKVARKGQPSLRGHCVPIDEHSYIPVPPEVLRQKLEQRLEEKAVEEWQGVCTTLQELVHEELRELRWTLSDSYQPFDPARRRWVGSWPLPDKEERFARQFLRAASLAGFTPLSRFDLEKTRELKADLLSLPVTINWDRLDSRWIESLLEDAEEGSVGSVPEALSDFGGYVLALKRGLAVERCSGRLLIEKLECLQSQWLLSVGSLLQSLLYRISRLAVEAWRTVLPAARGWAESPRGKALQQRLRRLKAAATRGVHLAKQLWEAGRSIRMRISGMQVLRRLQPSSYRYAQWLFGDVLNERWSTERAALIKRLARAWEQEVALRGQSRHLPVTAEVWKAAKEQGNFLERVAVEHVTSFSLTTLLQHAELQEPQFQEILVAYRLKGDTDSDYQPPPRRQICVRRFFEVAMKDIKLVMPQEAWRVRGRPLDMIRVDLLTMVGLLSVFSHILANTNKWLAVVPVVLLSARTYANYRRVKVGSKSRIASMLFDHCLDKDAALIRLLPDSAEAQVFSECALAYWSLLVASSERPEESPIIGREELSWRGAEVVRQLVNEVDLPEAGISPDLEEAYDRLARWGLVKVQEDGLQLTAGRQPTAFASGGRGSIFCEIFRGIPGILGIDGPPGEISWEGM